VVLLVKGEEGKGRAAKAGAMIDPNSVAALSVAVIDGPYDASTLSEILARSPINLGNSSCEVDTNVACNHGTFIMGILGARSDAMIPGLCPGCQLLHVRLFLDEFVPSASVGELAKAISVAVEAGARLVNVSLAILGDGAQNDHRLATALDYAEASGAVLFVAAGNQGRLAEGQLLAHPVAIPVVAVDAAHRLLPACNFGPTISRRGVAALGQHVVGYAPGGGTTVMSGTSVATAVATGTLAELWAARPNVDGNQIRAAVAQLTRGNELVPPALDRNGILSALDQICAAKVAAASPAGDGKTGYRSLRGERIMDIGNRLPRSSNPCVGPAPTSGHTVFPADGSAGCNCGSLGGVCTCNGSQGGASGFVYAIGTVEADYPNIAIERETQALAHTLLPASWQPNTDVPTKPTEDRSWQHAVLSADREMTRYITRQLIWRLTVEDYPVFVLKPRDPRDFDLLVDSLGRPKYPKPDGGDSETKGTGKRKAKRSIPIDSPIGRPQDLDVVIGVTGSQTPLGMEVLVDQIFHISAQQLAPGGLDVFAQLSDNYGLTDEDRAYNFLAARYTIAPDDLDEIKELGLAGVPIISSRLSGNTGRVVRVIFTLRSTQAIEKKYFVRVDVSDRFPFIVTPWQPYLERGGAS